MQEKIFLTQISKENRLLKKKWKMFTFTKETYKCY